MSLPTDLVPFQFDNKPIRVAADEEGDPWFIAADICRVLEIEHVGSAIRILDPDERGVRTEHTPSGDQTMAIISEPGLYKIMGRSRKPEAKRFDRWVRHEVLPAIRKTGAYVASGQHVAVASLDAEVRKALGGIIKSVVTRVVDEKFGELEQRIQAITDGFDPRAVATEYKPMFDVLVEEGVYPKKRRALSSRCSKLLLRFCIETGKISAVRASRETKRWLFQQDAIREWLDHSGHRIIAEHKALVSGQTVLQFTKPKPSDSSIDVRP